jgi:hypothetical protein
MGEIADLLPAVRRVGRGKTIGKDATKPLKLKENMRGADR